MKKLVGIILLLLLIVQAKSQIYNFEVDGKIRKYYLHIPDSLSVDRPLMFLLHGYSGSGASIRNYSKMNLLANEFGFAVCYPEGTFDDSNNRFWNVGYDFHQNEDANDVKFITELAKRLQTEFNLSHQNTFVSGMSNGGDMSYLLACQASDIFSAIAPVAGCMMKWIYDSCQPDKPIPVFEIHGTNDNITYWNGDIYNQDGWGAYMGVETAITFWSDKNKCKEYTYKNLPNLDPNDGSDVIFEKYYDGLNNNEVWLYKIVNGGHDWPGSSGNMDIDASTEIWRFFQKVIDNNQNLGLGEDITKNYFSLKQNQPNPFSKKTTINYSITRKSEIQIIIYDMFGREIVELANKTQNPGTYSIEWYAKDESNKRVENGLYFYVIRSDQTSQTKKMIVID